MKIALHILSFLTLFYLEHFSQQCFCLAFKRVTVLGLLCCSQLSVGLLVSSCDKSGLLCQNWQEHFPPHTATLATPEALPSHLPSHLSSAKPDLLCLRCCFSYLKRSTSPCKIYSEQKEATEDTTLVLAKFSAPLPVFLPNHKHFCQHHLHQSFTFCAPEQLS